MKPSLDKENRVASPSKLRHALMLALGVVVGSIGTCHFDSQDAKQEREKLEGVLAQKDKALADCGGTTKQVDRQLRQMKLQLDQVIADKERLNNWQVFLKGLRDRDAASFEAEGDLAGQCRELEESEAEAKAIKALDLFGISNEADRQAVIDSYRQGCYINNITAEGGLNMQLRDDTYCSVELEEPLDKEFVNPDDYEKASDAERVAMDRLKDKDYEGALEAYEPVLNELEALVEADPGIKGLPFYEGFKREFRAVYEAFRKGDTLRGICEIGMAYKILGDLEKSPALGALVDGENANLDRIVRILALFSDIIKAKGDKEYPQFRESDLDSPEIVEACRQIGMDIAE